MVKLSRIMFLTLILTLQDFCVECFQNVVIVNNTQMTYHNGKLVEFDKVVPDKKTVKKPGKVIEKSNIFKSTAFVTDSKFKGLVTKKNFTTNRIPPSRGNILTKNKKNPTPTKASKATIYPTTSTTTPMPLTAIIFSDDFSSTENSLHNAYDDIKTDLQQNSPTIRPESLESTIFVYSTPSPTTLSSIILKKTKKKRKKNTTTTPLPLHEHIIKNLDYYRKLLAINCTKKESEKQAASDQIIVSITPKPSVNVKMQGNLVKKLNFEDFNESSIEGKSDKKKKKYCKKKHHHSHHSHHKDSHEHHHGHHHDHHGHGHHHNHHGHGHHHDHHGHGHHQKDSYSHEQSESHSKEHKKKHGSKLKKQVYHKHIHVAEKKNKKKWPKDHQQEEIIYYDIPWAQEFEKAGDVFNTFYGFFEDALTSKENIPYHRDLSYKSDSGSDYDSSYFFDHNSHWGRSFVKPISKKNPLIRNSSVKSIKKRSIESKSLRNPRNMMKITLTSEYDDSFTGQKTSATLPTKYIPNEPSKKKSKKRKNVKKQSQISDESEEYTLYDEIMGYQDELDDSGDIDNDMRDSIEYYEDEIPSNRLPDGDIIERTEEYSDENVEPSSIFDNFTNMFSSLGSFFSSFTNDKSRNPISRYDDDYDEEGRATTLKSSNLKSANMKVKRPKRENVANLPWYKKSSFLLSEDSVNWLTLPWNHNGDIIEEENDIITTTEKTSSDSYDIVEKVKQYILPQAQNELVNKNKKHKRNSQRKKYAHYQLWRIFPKSRDDRNLIENFKTSSDGLNVHWLDGPSSSKGSIDAVIPPNFVENVQQVLEGNEVSYSVKNRNIYYAIVHENPRLNKREQIEMEIINGHPLTFARYHSYKDIQLYFDFIKRKFANNVELLQIGWSYEGRPLTIVKLTNHIESKMLPKEPRKSFQKPAIFMQSGSSGNEWMNIASSLFILNKIITKMNGNQTDIKLIESFDWYFLPINNPDGYEYSFNHDRLWKKSRSKHFPATSLWTSAINWLKTNANNECYGVDLNKNFDYNWMKNGASNNECSEFYAGPYAFSEPETKLVSEFIASSNRNIQLFVSLSGYGRKISFSSKGLNQDQIDDVRDIARAGIKAAKTSKFTIDSKSKRSGSIDTFAMYKAKIKYSFNVETSEDENNSFFVPSTSIEEYASEMFEIVYEMVKKIKEL